MKKRSLMWFRRDLRAVDNMALSYATNNFDEVYPVFIFDEKILSKLKSKTDSRLTFIWNALEQLKENLGSNITLLYGDPVKLIPELTKKLDVQVVVTNKDYEPYAKKRDLAVSKNLENCELKTFKDTVIFEANEVLTKSRTNFKVFTPYFKEWLYKLETTPQADYKHPVDLSKIKNKKSEITSIEDIGFSLEVDEKRFVNSNPAKVIKNFLKKIDKYDEARDFPFDEGTSRLSVHLRFGTVSIRELVRLARKKQSPGAHVWLSELAWREFYFTILDVFPYVEKSAYIKKYENIKYENDKKLFKKWCEGQTGVPIVDAAMRQLNQTGWMHNRLRMITASYLIKTLLIDWRWGEKYFKEKLIDFDLSANNGGWQWAASTGCDAAPYFRIFNPYRQSERFDKEGRFIKKYCPELSALSGKLLHDPSKLTLKAQKDFLCEQQLDYPAPIADYKLNRIKAINLYKNASL